MKINKFIALSLLFLIGGANAYAQKVSNISSRQEQNTIIVSYDLETPTPCKISLYVSTDGGNIWQGPLKKIDSNYTESVTKGTHEIIWNVLEEFEELSGNEISFKITAESINKNNVASIYPDDNQKKIYLAEIEKLNKAIKLNPKNASAYKARAELRLKLDSSEYHELIIIDFGKAIAINPKDALAYKARALHSYDYNIAIQDINKSILLNSTDSQNYLIRGYTNVLRFSKYQDAIKDYNKSIELNPKEGLAFLLRANCKIILKDYVGSLEDIEEAFKLGCLDKSLSDGLFNESFSARCYYERGKANYLLSNKTYSYLMAKSFEDFNNYILINGFLSSRVDLSEYVFVDDDYNKLAFWNQYINKFPDEIRALKERIDIEININDFKNAEADIENFLFLSKKNSLILNEIDLDFGFNLFEKNQNNLASKLLNKAIELSPSHDTYKASGQLKAKLKDYKGAIVDFTKAITFDQKNSETFVIRANAKEELNDYTGAMGDYTTAIMLNPKNRYIYNLRGNLKQYNLKDYRGAILDYNKALSLNPEFPIFSSFYYTNRGNAKYNIKDYKGAILDYTKAISLDPEEGENYFNRGDAKIKIKDKIGGCKDLSKAGELGYNEAYSLINEHCN